MNLDGEGVNWWPESMCNDEFENGIHRVEICPWPEDEDEPKIKQGLIERFKAGKEVEEQMRRLKSAARK